MIDCLKKLLGLGAGAAVDAARGAPTRVEVSKPLPTFSAPVGPPEGLHESRRLAHCHPRLGERFLGLRRDFKDVTGMELIITCTYRSPERQQELYQKGRRGIEGESIVTKIDGVSRRSRHNHWPALGIDVAVDTDPGPGKHISWQEDLYEPLGALAAKHGLRWGGDWDQDGETEDERWRDLPHLELPAADV